MLGSKLITIFADGLDPYTQGKENFKNKLPEIEELASKRLEVCKGCRYFKDEPIHFFHVTDNNLPDVTGKSCGKCGCILSYKLRQSLKPCSKWSKR